MKIATWNIERLKHKADVDRIYAEIQAVRADILVLTETDSRVSPEYAYCYSTLPLAEQQPEYYGETENRVSIFTNYPCVKYIKTYDDRTAICAELETDLGNLAVYGTIIGIFGNREKSFKPDLVKQMEDIKQLSSAGKAICMLGDYNLSFCDNYYYTSFGRETVNETFTECGIEIVTRNRPECVDHIAISRSFVENKSIEIEEWNYDKALSDHKGIVVYI